MKQGGGEGESRALQFCSGRCYILKPDLPVIYAVVLNVYLQKNTLQVKLNTSHRYSTDRQYKVSKFQS